MGYPQQKNVQYTRGNSESVCVYVCIEAIKKTPFFKYHYKRWDCTIMYICICVCADSFSAGVVAQIHT